MFGIRKTRGFYDDFEAGFGLCILGAPAGPAQAAVAGASGSAGCSLLFAIPPLKMLRLAVKPVTSWQPASVLLTLYLITFLQRILESRSQIRLAQEDLNRLFHNHRINILGACLFIGLLPSAASMLLCAELVKNETEGCLSPRDQVFTASWLRHIPESALPTYTAVLLILAFDLDVVAAVSIVCVLAAVIYRVRPAELKRFFLSAFEKKMLGNTLLVLILKEFLSRTGALEALPRALSALPLPSYLIFGLLFFLAMLVSGSTAAIAMAAPLAFSAAQGNVPRMVFLMCVTHGASQLLPTHVCLVVAADYFHLPLGSLVRRTIPAVALFCLGAAAYYQLLL